MNGPTSSWSLEVETHPTFSCSQSLFLRALRGTDSHAARERASRENTSVSNAILPWQKARVSHISTLRTSILSLCLIQLVVVLSISLYNLSFYSLWWVIGASIVFMTLYHFRTCVFGYKALCAIELANTSRPSCYQSVVPLHWIPLDKLLRCDTSIILECIRGPSSSDIVYDVTNCNLISYYTGMSPATNSFFLPAHLS